MSVTEIEEKTIEELAEEFEQGEQFTIPGTGPTLTTDAGGRRPDVAEAKLASVSLHVQGEFKKGDRVRILVDAVCQKVQNVDEYKGPEVQRTRRVHIFRPLMIVSAVGEE
jgi:hypothetical protein